MRAGIKKLIESEKDIVIGNHAKKFSPGSKIYYWHYGEVIVTVHTLEKTIAVTKRKFGQSTTAAINSYRQHYLGQLHYTEI